MADLRYRDISDVIDCASAALARAWGCDVRLDNVRSLSDPNRRNLVVRAVASRAGGASRPVIVKATRSSNYDPACEKPLEASGLVREWTATAYIAAAAPNRNHGAALIAGNIESGILVFEDLGEGLPSLVDPLLRGRAEEAEASLCSYAIALARLHADTNGCAAAYHGTFQSIFGSGREPRPLGWRVEADAGVIANAIGHAPPQSELELISSRLGDPGPWQALVHGDPCPDNVLLCKGEARLIDYEWARPAHALLDGTYWRMGFPTCWCAGRTPADVCARLDAVYREELAKAIPSALDETAYRAEAAYMSAAWLFTGLSWRLGEALEGDDRWGICSIRGRLLWYLETVIQMTQEADVLPGIRQAASKWATELSRRWPDAQPMGLYPAFAPEAPNPKG